MPLTVLVPRNFLSDFLRDTERKAAKKRPLCVFETPFGGLEAAYNVRLKLIGKRIVDFLLVIIELFSLGITADALRANIDWKSLFLTGWVILAQNFR